MLLRLPVDGTDWSDHLPPAPADHDVSASCSDRSTWARLRPGLVALGYRAVDEPADPTPTGEIVVDLVLRDGLVEARPTWWRAVAALADRAYPLLLGPAARRWSVLLAAHEATADRAGRR